MTCILKYYRLCSLQLIGNKVLQICALSPWLKFIQLLIIDSLKKFIIGIVREALTVVIGKNAGQFMTHAAARLIPMINDIHAQGIRLGVTFFETRW